jgi:hypothetical protein
MPTETHVLKWQTEVVIVPWIDGFFVLPDLNEERSLAIG